MNPIIIIVMAAMSIQAIFLIIEVSSSVIGSGGVGALVIQRPSILSTFNGLVYDKVTIIRANFFLYL